MSVSDQIEEAIRAAFAVREIEIVNESHKHAGHAGDDGSGESHFHMRLRAPELGGLTRVARHRAVHKAMGPELTDRIHALSLDLDG